MRKFRGRYATTNVYNWSNCEGKTVEGKPHAHITGVNLTITQPNELKAYMAACEFGQRTIREAVSYWKQLEVA